MAGVRSTIAVSIAGLSDTGVIAGKVIYVPDQPAPHMFTFDGSSFHDLVAILPPGDGAVPYGVDNNGNVYGHAYSPFTSPPGGDAFDFITDYSASGYTLGTGSNFNNNLGGSLVGIDQVVNGAGWTLLTANATNSQGQIAGLGEYKGYLHAYLLTPVPNVVFAGLSPATSILNITEVFGGNTPAPNGPGSSLTISGNTGPGGGSTSMITVTAGPMTRVNGVNAVSFTAAFPGAIKAINVNLLNDNDSLTIGTSTGMVNLPGTSLNVTVGGGNDTFTMGTAGSATAAAVNNILGGVTWKAANPNGTGTESVSILNTTVGSINVQESSGPGDAIQLWGVTATGSVTLTQNHGAGDTISIDQLNATNPGSPSPTVSLIPSALGTLRTSQGNGSNDNTTVNRTTIGNSYTGSQGNGMGDSFFLGAGDTVGTAVGSVYGGPVQLTQGTGSGNYLGLADLQAGATTLLQQDVSDNLTGDTVGGVSTPAIPTGSSGSDSPSPTTAANLVTALNNATLLGTVPTNGLAGAILEQLNITQGSAGSDLVALVQLPAGATTSASLNVAGGTNISGTITIVQQDIPGGRSDAIFLGSYIPGSGTFTSQSPPFPYTPGTVGAIGSVTALNEVVTQGNAAGDVLSVLFNTATAARASSLFTQGNGGDQAVFQENTTAGGALNYKGGSGGNRVQADSNGAAGTFDGGSNVVNNHLTQDKQNPFLVFVDFGDTIFG
jgi:hypothetical protein